METEWDSKKAVSNIKKHGVNFADAVAVLEDERAITISEDWADEERFITIGMGSFRRILVVVYTWRGTRGLFLPEEQPLMRKSNIWVRSMNKEYDFSKGKRGSVIKVPKGKTRITIRLDEDILDWFRRQVHAAGGGNYQTLINNALREYVNSKREPLEETLRHVIREELAEYGKKSRR